MKERFKIIGGNKLFGEIENQTSKNATLPIMSASLLCERGVVKLHKCPNISDVKNMEKLLLKLGVKIWDEKGVLCIDSSEANNFGLDCNLMKTMRSSLFLLGPMLNRFKKVSISSPGGCKIGSRPIDVTVESFKKLGVKVYEQGDLTSFDATNAKSGRVKLKLPSVGATENIIQFACLLKGKTTIYNSAREPEIIDLCNFLNLMGAKIFGAGTSKITIYGVNKLHAVEYMPMADRIVSGTIMCAVAICGGDVKIKNGCSYENEKLIEILRLMGCQIEVKHDIIHITSYQGLKFSGEISTGYFPDFPTDSQSNILAVSTCCSGEIRIIENIFENRFLIVPELVKMGAYIRNKNPREVVVKGACNLTGKRVKAKDLRGGASLVLAGLASKGETIVSEIEHIDRGYENIEQILSSLGANIRRI